MKNFNLFSILGLMTILLIFTSCQKEDNVILDTESVSDELITPPLTPEELDIVWEDMESNENNVIESRTNCGCKRFHASRRTNTSSYIYCQRYQDNNSDGNVIYFLAENDGPNNHAIRESNYYTIFYGLTSGSEYKAKAIINCTDGDTFRTDFYFFTQNGHYPAPLTYN